MFVVLCEHLINNEGNQVHQFYRCTKRHMQTCQSCVMFDQRKEKDQVGVRRSQNRRPAKENSSPPPHTHTPSTGVKPRPMKQCHWDKSGPWSRGPTFDPDIILVWGGGSCASSRLISGSHSELDGLCSRTAGATHLCLFWCADRSLAARCLLSSPWPLNPGCWTSSWLQRPGTQQHVRRSVKRSKGRAAAQHECRCQEIKAWLMFFSEQFAQNSPKTSEQHKKSSIKCVSHIHLGFYWIYYNKKQIFFIFYLVNLVVINLVPEFQNSKGLYIITGRVFAYLKIVLEVVSCVQTCASSITCILICFVQK